MLILYQNTKLKPSQNARYENLEAFLGKGIQSAAFDRFQYIKPALETYVKIDVEDAWLKKKGWDYAKVINGDGNAYYYFVTRHKWVNDHTLGLTLALDTINTFWDSLRFTDKTHITRRFKDRFKIRHLGSSDYITPVVDKFAEDLTIPPMYRTSVSVLGDRHLWYLIQRTDYDANTVKENPVSTYLLKDERIDIDNGAKELLAENLLEGRAYLIEGSDITRLIKPLPDTTGGDPIKISYAYSDAAQYGYFYRVGGEIRIKLRTSGVQTIKGKTSIELVSLDHVYLQREGFDLKDGNDSDMSYDFDYDTKLTYDSYGGAFSVLSFSEWYRFNKTDTNLVKITCLPYCPVNLNALHYGQDYEATAYGIRLLNPNIEYETPVATDLISVTSYDKKVAKAGQPYDLQYETKRWNSNYHTVKYAYDNNVMAFNLELFSEFETGSSNSATLSITFNYNKEMSNSLAFRFDCDYRYSSDYGEWLVCSKSLDVPYFTNEYLNYLRYGKAVDERNAGWNIAGTLLSGASTGVGAFAAAKSAATLAQLTTPIGAISAGVSGISTAVSVASSVMKARDSINSKIDAYTHQASNVNGTSDLSIFKAYGDNKLLKVEYDPPKELLDPILDYFRLYGYSADEYAVPDFDTRYYSDYVAMEPDFEEESIDSDYLDDFKARCESGLRIYHYHDGYDLECDFEN